MYKSNNVIRVEKNNRRQYNITVIPKKINLFFILIQIFFGLDFGFIVCKSKKNKFFVKLTTFLVSVCYGIVIISMLFEIADYFYLTWGFKFFFEYYLYIFILIFTSDDRTFYFYQIQLQQFDNKAGVPTSSFKLANKMIFYLFFLFSFNVLVIFLYYVYRDDYELQMYTQLLFFIPLLTSNIPIMIHFFVYLSMFYRLERIKILIENRKYSVHSLLQHYKFLVESIENVMKSFTYIYILSLLLNIPGVIASIYYLLETIQKTGYKSFELLVPFIPLLLTITNRATPAVAATWLGQEAMEIKLTLYKRIFEEKDIRQILAMERFLRYIEARPFKFYMLYLLPMDVSLLAIILEFCITYIIIIAQMTHIV